METLVSHDPEDLPVPWVFTHHLGAASPEHPELELLHPELAGMKEKCQADKKENSKNKSKFCLV